MAEDKKYFSYRKFSDIHELIDEDYTYGFSVAVFSAEIFYAVGDRSEHCAVINASKFRKDDIVKMIHEKSVKLNEKEKIPNKNREKVDEIIARIDAYVDSSPSAAN